MKHIPTLTLIALASAASAQTAPAAAPGFNYNTIAVNYSNEDFKDIADGLTMTTVALTNKLGKNVYATVGVVVSGAEQFDDGTPTDLSDGLLIGLGYIYSLSSTTDLTLSVTSLNANTSNGDSQSISRLAFDLGVRHNLGGGLELTGSLGRDTYTHEDSASVVASDGSDRTTLSVGVAYAVTKEVSLAAKANWAFTEDDTDSRGYSLSASYSY